MPDLSSLLTVGGLAAFLTLLLQFGKQLLTDTKYVPLIALALGIILALVIAFATGKLVTNEAVVSYVILGILAAVSSVGIHENLSTPWQPSAPNPAPLEPRTPFVPPPPAA